MSPALPHCRASVGDMLAEPQRWARAKAFAHLCVYSQRRWLNPSFFVLSHPACRPLVGQGRLRCPSAPNEPRPWRLRAARHARDNGGHQPPCIAPMTLQSTKSAAGRAVYLNSLRLGMSALVLSCVFLSAPAAGQLLSEPESEAAWTEAGYAMPAPPRQASLREFDIGATASDSRYFVDASSLEVGSDGVLRYVLVVRSAGGAESVTFEGLRCAAGAWRVYAVGRPNGEWIASRDESWRPIAASARSRGRGVLASDYFCDGTAALRNRDEALTRLSEGRKLLY